MAARQSSKPWWRSRGVKTAPKRGGLVWFNLVDGGWCRLEDFSRFRGLSSTCSSPFGFSALSVTIVLF